MLVLITQGRVLSPQKICRSCMFASQSGEPRWQNGSLTCGRGAVNRSVAGQSQKCPMGFRVMEIRPDE